MLPSVAIFKIFVESMYIIGDKYIDMILNKMH